LSHFQKKNQENAFSSFSEMRGPYFLQSRGVVELGLRDSIVSAHFLFGVCSELGAKFFVLLLSVAASQFDFFGITLDMPMWRAVARGGRAAATPRRVPSG